MTDLRTAAQQALTALREITLEYGMTDNTRAAITALKTALAEPVQEPVAWRYKYSDGFWRFSNGSRVNGCDPIESQALYAAPPQRKPLTDEEIKPLVQRAMTYYGYDPERYGLTASAGFEVLARAIELAHGIGDNR